MVTDQSLEPSFLALGARISWSYTIFLNGLGGEVGPDERSGPCLSPPAQHCQVCGRLSRQEEVRRVLWCPPWACRHFQQGCLSGSTCPAELPPPALSASSTHFPDRFIHPASRPAPGSRFGNQVSNECRAFGLHFQMLPKVSSEAAEPWPLLSALSVIKRFPRQIFGRFESSSLPMPSLTLQAKLLTWGCAN